MLEAVVPIGKTGHPFWLEQLEKFGAEGTVSYFAQRLEFRQDVRQIEYLKLPDPDRPELGVRRRQHLHRTELQRFEFFLVLVELRVRIDFNLDLAVGVLLGQFLEFQGSLAFGCIWRDDVAELDDDR